MNHPKVIIIILNWNGLEDTIECLESLKKITYPNYEVIVVDNGSEGNDAQVLKERFGDYIQLIQNDKNYGFAEGNNIGIRYALANSFPEYFLLLNNDTVVAHDFLTELVKTAESDGEIGIVGPKIYYYDFGGRKDVIWSAGGKIGLLRPHVSYLIGYNDDDLPKYQAITSVDWIIGAAMLFKSCMIEKLSLLNSEYFFGFEDIEYSIKARKHGFKVVYVPTARIWHKVGASRKKCDPNFANPSPYYRFIKENFSVFVYIYQLLLLLIIILPRWVIAYLVKDIDKETLFKFLSNFRNFISQKQ